MINVEFLLEIIIACVIMGCGIGADVAIATFVRAQQLNKQNQKLKSARDILLPRLMNRTIEV